MQFARNVPQGGLLRRNQFLGQLAALGGERRQLRKQLPVGTDRIQSGQQNGHQREREKQIDLALHPVVNLGDAQSCLLFAFVVLHQQARHRRAQRRLSRLQRKLDLGARLAGLAARRQREGAIDRVPELGHGVFQILTLFRSTVGNRNLLLFRQSVVQVSPHPLELRRPRGQRIRLVVIQHVAHGQRQGVEIVLNAQQLQGVFAVAVHQIVLQFPQAGDLPGDVSGIGHHGGQGNDQPQDKSRSWRPMRRIWARHEPRIQRAGVKCHCGEQLAIGSSSVPR